MKAKLKPGTPVHIVWLDSQTSIEKVWIDRADADTLSLCEIRALGFVLSDKPDSLVLAGHIGGKSATCLMVIPRGCITHITELTQVKHG